MRSARAGFFRRAFSHLFLLEGGVDPADFAGRSLDLQPRTVFADDANGVYKRQIVKQSCGGRVGLEGLDRFRSGIALEQTLEPREETARLRRFTQPCGVLEIEIAGELAQTARGFTRERRFGSDVRFTKRAAIHGLIDHDAATRAGDFRVADTMALLDAQQLIDLRAAFRIGIRGQGGDGFEIGHFGFIHDRRHGAPPSSPYWQRTFHPGLENLAGCKIRTRPVGPVPLDGENPYYCLLYTSPSPRDS